MDSQFHRDVHYLPTGGVNLEDASGGLHLQENQALEVNGFVHQNGALRYLGARSVETITSSLPAGVTPSLARSFDLGGNYLAGIADGWRLAYGILRTSGSTDGLYKMISNGVATTFTNLTGPGSGGAMTFFDNPPASIDIVNGAILIATRYEILRHVLASGVYTLLAQPFHFVVGAPGNRAFAALKHPASLVEHPGRYTVAWSKSGDETDWSAFGSGTTVLAESATSISGLANIRNIIFIVRTDGLVLGYPTGVADPAFRFETVYKDGEGCALESTFCADHDSCFFVGQSNIYQLNLSGLKPIGGNIRKRVLELAKVSFLRGALVRSVYDIRKSFYIIHAVESANPEVFIYDIEADVWTTYTPGTKISASGMFFEHNTSSPYPTLAYIQFPDATIRQLVRVNQSGTGYAGSVTSRLIVPAELSKDYRLIRVMLTYTQGTGACTVTATARRGDGTVVTGTKTQNMAASNEVVRQWFELDNPLEVGNAFKLTASFTAPPKVLSGISLRFAESGEMR